MADETTTHREFHRLGQAVFILAPSCLALIVVAGSGGQPLSAWRVAALFAAVLGLMASYLGFGIWRMNRIILTPSQLTVGRDEFVPEDFDFSFGVQPPLILTPEQQRRIEEDWPLPPDTGVRIAGGSWGRRRGTRMLILKDAKTDELVVIFSRDSGALDKLLTAWLEQPPV